MYFVLYDRHLNSIGETYILESWSRTERATDFDELNIVGEQIPYSANPFLVVVNDKQGKQMFSGLASSPIINDKDKKTTITLKDYLTLFNSDIVINWSNFTGTYLNEYVDFILSTWLDQVDVGLSNIAWDLKDISNIELNPEMQKEGTESISVYSLISDAIYFYNLYNKNDIDLVTKTLTFNFLRSSVNPISIKLKDFGINVIEKSFGDYNRVTIYTSDYAKHEQWALTENNNIVKLPSDEARVYPAKNKNFIAQSPSGELTEIGAINNAVYEAVTGLAGNRFQENIDLDAQRYKSIFDLTGVDFSYRVGVYTKEGYYKEIPVGEIETNSNGKHIIRLGYRVQELTQEL